MADFSRAVQAILREEGGYQNSPSDTGNFACGVNVGTKYGISAPTLQANIGKCPLPSDMINLTLDQAARIYESKYWDKILGDTIANQSIAELLMDAIVNQGQGAISEMLDSVCRFLQIPISPDRPEIAQINDWLAKNPSKREPLFHEAFRQARKERYKGSALANAYYARLNRYRYISTTRPKKRDSKKGVIIGTSIAFMIGLGLYLYFKN